MPTGPHHWLVGLGSLCSVTGDEPPTLMDRGAKLQERGCPEKSEVERARSEVCRAVMKIRLSN